MRLEGKVAVVTGAGNGIGRCAGLRFAREGATVFLADVDGAAVEATQRAVSDAGGAAHAVACDVSDPDQVAALFERVDGEVGRLDVLYNNAGTAGPPGGVTDVDVATWNRVIDINVNGAFHCIRGAIPLMSAGGGSIINQASVAALVGGGPPAVGPVAAYTTAKSALLGLTRSVAYQFGERGVRCNALLPGTIDTAMTQPLMDSEAYVDGVVKATPLQRFGRPEEVASTALFLASDEASFITGESIVLDGGFVIAQGPVYTRMAL
ncbi:SDR family oxidoreductase [Ectothiorhodospiraceae bacterium WFHF3C12]|nr:SDR family oxidoreductase [Ectothiorhodospiraceae bacterium WFHF3C12]